mgnify:CR=1 FL=1|jgi:hypothetical protein
MNGYRWLGYATEKARIVMQELSCKMGQPGNLIQWTGTTRGYGFKWKAPLWQQGRGTPRRRIADRYQKRYRDRAAFWNVSLSFTTEVSNANGITGVSSGIIPTGFRE